MKVTQQIPVVIDDVLVYSSSIDEHRKHLYSFLDTIKRNSLVVSTKKVKLFQTKVHFLGYDISKGQIRPILGMALPPTWMVLALLLRLLLLAYYFQLILLLYNYASASNAVSPSPFMVLEPFFSGR